MPALADYLELTTAAAREQWKRVVARPPLARGKRQGVFEPVEVLLCHGLFWILSPNRFGGSNIDKVPEEARALAQLFRRSAGSLTNKMLNLDGSRRHGGRAEVELYVRLSVEPGRFVRLYRIVIQAGRELALGPDLLPDYLHWMDRADQDLLGQDEIGQFELEIALREQAANRHFWTDEQGLDEPTTTRLVEQRVRHGQHRFARKVLANFEQRCGFCGFSPVLLGMRRGLVASHIKPWKDSKPRERLDPRNGVAACPIHDVAFDQGFLTVNGGLKVHRAERLGVLVARDSAAEQLFGRETVARRLLLPAGSPQPGKSYLSWHHEHIWAGRGLP